MRVVKGVKNLEKRPTSYVLSIGNFDGVHVGHQKILAKLNEWGAKYQVPIAVMTFEPHPEQVLFPDRKLKKVISREEQFKQFEKWGVDLVILEPFDLKLAQVPASIFLKDSILKPFLPKGIVVGYDFSFGAGRSGNREFLQNQGLIHGYEFEVMEAVKVEDCVVSSTEIRKLLAQGEVEKVSHFLGRNYFFEAEVTRGDALGAKIGFPTANLCWDEELVRPPMGVYAGTAQVCGKSYFAVANFGVRPTVQSQNHQPKLEVHLLDFDKDLYGKKMGFDFLQFIRPEKKFMNLDELKKQIAEDIVQVKKYFQKKKVKESK